MKPTHSGCTAEVQQVTCRAHLLTCRRRLSLVLFTPFFIALSSVGVYSQEPDNILDKQIISNLDEVNKLIEKSWGSEVSGADKAAMSGHIYEKLDEFLVKGLRTTDFKKVENFSYALELVQLSKRSNSPEVTSALLEFICFQWPTASISVGNDEPGTPEKGYNAAQTLIVDRNPGQVQGEILKFIKAGKLRPDSKVQAQLIARVWLMSFLTSTFYIPRASGLDMKLPSKSDAILPLKQALERCDIATEKGKIAKDSLSAFIKVVGEVPFNEGSPEGSNPKEPPDGHDEEKK